MSALKKFVQEQILIKTLKLVGILIEKIKFNIGDISFFFLDFLFFDKQGKIKKLWIS